MSISYAMWAAVLSGFSGAAGLAAGYGWSSRAAREKRAPCLADAAPLEAELLRSAAGALIVLDASLEKVLWANGAAESLLGFSRADWERGGVSLVSAPDRRERLAATLRAALKDGCSADADSELLRKDGSRAAVSLTANRLAVGGAEAVALGMRDSSTLRALHRQLLQSAKLAAIGQLVGGVAHELNNPLGAIRLHGELIGASLDLAPDAARGEIVDSLAIMDSCVDRMQKIISSLRRIARPISQGAREASINELVEQVLSLYGKRMRDEGISLQLDLGADLPAVAVDGQQIEQALLHVLSNAADAVKGAPERLISVRTRREGQGVACVIRDSGPGIPGANIERIFEPFFTTKGVGQGAGLGLPIADSIIKEHRGEIRLRNAPGEGAEFSIWLPSRAA